MRNYIFFSKTTVVQRESFPKIFYTINISPMLVTMSGFKLIFVLSNYQTCTFPLSEVCGSTILCKYLLSSVGSEKNWWLTTQPFLSTFRSVCSDRLHKNDVRVLNVILKSP